MSEDVGGDGESCPGGITYTTIGYCRCLTCEGSGNSRVYGLWNTKTGKCRLIVENWSSINLRVTFIRLDLFATMTMWGNFNLILRLGSNRLPCPLFSCQTQKDDGSDSVIDSDTYSRATFILY